MYRFSGDYDVLEVIRRPLAQLIWKNWETSHVSGTVTLSGTPNLPAGRYTLVAISGVTVTAFTDTILRQSYQGGLSSSGESALNSLRRQLNRGYGRTRWGISSALQTDGIRSSRGLPARFQET